MTWTRTKLRSARLALTRLARVPCGESESRWCSPGSSRPTRGVAGGTGSPSITTTPCGGIGTGSIEVPGNESSRAGTRMGWASGSPAETYGLPAASLTTMIWRAGAFHVIEPAGWTLKPS